MDPKSEMSTSWHEPIGPCNETIIMQTVLGKVLSRKKYFCPHNHKNANYFGWSCLPNQKPPKNGSKWYTICGTPLSNRIEYIIILFAVSIFSCSFFFKTLCNHQRINNKTNQNLKNCKDIMIKPKTY